MQKYNPKKIEKKWQEYWEKNPKLSAVDEKSKKPKFYCLDMFPYPSGDGLHVGHVEGYTASDIYSRYQRMIGKNVLHPMGWDAFGLPAENFAIKTGVHPDKSTHQNIKNFTKQINSLGLSYDWSREIDTSSPEYYKWTQWFFLFLYKHGLAYRKKAKVNWCESCKTVLANEQVEDGACERCKNEVIQKDLEQWFFRITDFAEDLISDLDKIDWPESTKTAQKNWIGKSEGAVVKFSIFNFQFPNKSKFQNDQNYLEVFTTRLDTIYGCTYCVVAPEHPLIEKLKSEIANLKEVEKYVKLAKKKTDLQRTELQKEKTGIEIKGIKATNPFTKEDVPIFVADYVLSTYGTGAVMAVPAHDERDFEFAKKYKLSIKQVVAPYSLDEKNPPRKGKKNTTRKVVHVILEDDNGKVLTLNLKGEEWGKDKPKTFIIGGIEDGESIEQAVLREVKEETGYTDVEIRKIIPIEFHAEFFAAHKDVNRYVMTTSVVCRLKSEKKEAVSENEKKLHDLVWVKRNELIDSITIPDDIFLAKVYLEKIDTYTESGILLNSGKYSGHSSEKAREEMAKWLEKNKLGKKTTTYKLRDWLISRQRYWGAPIPIVYCENCAKKKSSALRNFESFARGREKPSFDLATIDGKEYAIIPVPEKDLPVLLPKVKDYRPKGTSPLGTNLEFANAFCPKCQGEAKRELDTMDTFVCSSWYFFRFADPKNKKEFAAKDKIKKWLPVDLYVGGAEHTVLHLLYARFFTKSLHKYKYINFNEPFQKLRHQGLVIAEDGRKMSKSLGNVINPDDIVKQYGADVLRLYEMFMGPMEDSKSWNTKSIVGLKRFLERVWKLNFKFQISNFKSNPKYKFQISKLDSLLHKTIKKVTEDIENLHFNTAISSMMILVNEMEKENIIQITNYKILITLLSPFAPHIAEELWLQLGNKKSIFLEKWPKFDPKLVAEKEVNIVVQVNGKVRDQLTVAANTKEDEIKKLAFASEKIKKYIPNIDNIRKIIFVPGRLINLVV
jgi:leucyl-tRNA synthetase